MGSNARCVILATLLIGMGLPAAGDPPATGEPPEDRHAAGVPETAGPRIALVLGGGGARGAAHVGVLQALEAMQIPIHMVVGTSMGAVVGGMYAAGLSPEEIEGEMAMIDWPLVFEDRGRRKDLPFRRKEEDLRTLGNFEMGFKGSKLVPPRGLVAGQKFNFLLTAYTLRVAGIEDFDRLPIPFRAVATDLEDGSWVALGKGDLAEAIRASLSIPGVFAPVEIDGRLLVDGGPANNLPTDVALQMGADVVIAVDVGTPLAKREDLESLVAVATQMSNMLTRRNVVQRLPLADVVITPDLEGIRTGEFTRVMETVPLGVEAVEREAGALAEFAVSPDAFESHLRRQRRPQRESLEVAFIHVEGPEALDSRVITHRIRTQPGSLLDLEALLEDLGRLYELGDFERVVFRLVERDGQTGIHIRAEERHWGPSRVRFAFNFAEEFRGPNNLNALVQFSRTNVNRSRGEWRTELQLGRTYRIQTELYQPLDFGSRSFVLPMAELRSTSVDVFDDLHQVAEYRVNSGIGGVFLGHNLGRIGEARIGVQWGKGRARVNVGSPDLPEYDVTVAAVVGRLVFDTLDHADIPHRGVYARLDGSAVRRFWGGDESYNKVQGEVGRWFSRGHQTYFVNLAAGSGFSGSLPDYDQFALGGLLSLSGFREGQLSGRHFAVVRTGFYRQLSRSGTGFARAVYAGGWIEGGNAWMERGDAGFSDLHWSVTAALGIRTVVGPLYLAYGIAEGGADRAHVFLGKRF